MSRVDLASRRMGVMWPTVAGRCPMGCGSTLFLGSGGYITCSWHKCPNPVAVSDLLDDPLAAKHVVTFGELGFDVQHPLFERGEDLVRCELHQHIRLLDGPPVRPGRYFAEYDGSRWIWAPQ